MACCSLDQYQFRVREAITIKSISAVGEAGIRKRAKIVALAELTQIIFFVTQTIFYSLAFFGMITPQVAGMVVFFLLPIEGICSYHTFVHYKSCSRVVLTLAALFTLSSCAGFALAGVVADSAISLGVGGIFLHLFRNISEMVDSKRAQQQLEYRRDVLRENVIPA